jgi:transcription-repair coupling factor (superfamily II helicase)
MALMDIRQMSLINDPPPGRLPVRTYVRAYSREVIREAILRELARGGQVFYVYNRVESIMHVAERLQKLIPGARIGVGHGQMHEKELEPIMVGFVRGEIDILLSTTIVENGIDISNANTLIVENADRLGLSQLYQLRGRVGRSDRQAYAYFMYDHRKDLTENAFQRLTALQEFSSLGSGYSLAFRDLQIRGAGELLGAKQHGSMAAIGYELYTQLINDAVQLLKNSVDGELPNDEARDPLAALEPLPAFEVPVVALIPEGYVRDQAQRLYYYQQLMSCRSMEKLGEVQSEIEDRYGRPPVEVRNAISILALRLRAKEIGIDKLDANQGRIALSFKTKNVFPPRAYVLLGQKNPQAYSTREQYVWPYGGNPIKAIENLFQAFSDVMERIDADRAKLG